jgi:membrane protein
MQIQSAALAFYMIFSLLLIILWIAARFNKEVVVRQAIFIELGDLVGQGGAQQLMETVTKIHIHEPTVLATVLGFTVLIFTATNVFITTKISLNRICEVKKAPGKVISIQVLLLERLVSFILIITISILLLVLVGLDALVSALGSYSARWIGEFAAYMVVVDAFFIELILTTVLLAMFFRYLPGVKLHWKDTWLGAFVTTILLAAGEYLIGYLLGRQTVANLYEATGSVLLLMLWVYYASSIFLFGATLTFVRTRLLKVGLRKD